MGGALIDDLGVAADEDRCVDATLHDAHQPGEVDVDDVVGGTCVNMDVYTFTDYGTNQEYGTPTTHT